MKHKQAFIIWVAIYPLVLLLDYSLGEALVSFPMPIRTLITTAIAVPIMVYLLMPMLNKLFSKWLQQQENRD